MIFNTLSFLFLKADNFMLHQTNVFSMETLVLPLRGIGGNFFGKQVVVSHGGGSSFPEETVGKRGETILRPGVYQPAGRWHLRCTGNDLPVALAEGSYASLPGGLLCMGGQTPEGITGEVWLLSFDGASITATEYPPLPTPVKHSTATVIGSRVYLLGGELADGSSSSQFLVLDLNNLAVGWKRCPIFRYPSLGRPSPRNRMAKRCRSLSSGDGRRITTISPPSPRSIISGLLPAWNQKQNMQIKNGPDFPAWLPHRR